jgi:ABC-type uncharacterized transport system involved in gliding motility auxiliary subunit
MAFARQRSTRYGIGALFYSGMFVVILVMLNFLGTRYHARIDLSAEGVNSLSPQSIEVMKALDGEVTIDAFVEGGRDPVIAELFDAYRYHTTRISVSFVDPQLRPELAQRAGISQVPTLRVSKGERSTLVTSADEESVTNGIRRVMNPTPKRIYFVKGHGEPSIDDVETASGFGLFAQALRNQNYDVQTIVLSDHANVPEDAAALVAVATDKPYLPPELVILERYMRRGGRVLALLEPRSGAALADLFSQWGVTVGNDVILDQQMRLFEGATLGLEPIVSTYADHPAVASMNDRTMFSIARSVRPAESAPTTLHVVSIASTGRSSWAETDVARALDKSEADLESTDQKGPVSVGVAVSAYAKDIGGEGDAEFEMIVFGDTTFVTNKYWRQLFNDALALSALNWLAGEHELVSIGPRAVRASRAYLTETQALSVFYLSVLIAPEVILLCGVVVWWRRSSS